jgi:hypothetical protein
MYFMAAHIGATGQVLLPNIHPPMAQVSSWIFYPALARRHHEL